MNQPQIPPTTISLLKHYVRPWTLLASLVTYTLGGGIANYLGHTLNPARFLGGMLLALLLLLGGYSLKLYYDLIDAETPPRRVQKNTDELDLLVGQRLSRQQVLLLAISMLTAWAAVSVLMIAQGALRAPGLMLLGVGFFLAFFYGVPPLRLAHAGYGELVEAILIANLFPALAFTLQSGELHRLLPMLTFPLLALYLAMRLAQSLEWYARDQKLARRTLMIALGWQRGMQYHNGLIVLGYVLLTTAVVFGLPWSLTWPGFLTLPLAAFELNQMNQIAAGAKPNWRLLRLTSAATFGLTAYLLALAIWTG